MSGPGVRPTIVKSEQAGTETLPGGLARRGSRDKGGSKGACLQGEGGAGGRAAAR